MYPIDCPFCHKPLIIIPFKNEKSYVCNRHQNTNQFYKYCYYKTDLGVLRYFWCIIGKYGLRIYFDRPSFQVVDYRMRNANFDGDEKIVSVECELDIDISSTKDIKRVMQLLLKLASFA